MPSQSGHVAAIAADQPAPATMVVTLPAEAKLTIDGNPTTSTTARRVFNSPPLTRGKSYHYTLKAEVPVAGKTEVITKVIEVQAGRETEARLELPAPSVARSR
jgi:uncharacterized protein (TIGR03000 family)